jgi:hypothetical protein
MVLCVFFSVALLFSPMLGVEIPTGNTGSTFAYADEPSDTFASTLGIEDNAAGGLKAAADTAFGAHALASGDPTPSFTGAFAINVTREDASHTLKAALDKALAEYGAADGATYTYADVRSLTVTGKLTANNASSDMGVIGSLTGLTKLDLAGVEVSGSWSKATFQKLTGLVSAVLPKGNAYSSPNALFFGLSNLKEADVSGVGNIGSNTFNNCASLKTVVLPSSPYTIGQNAFARTGLESVDISNVTSIGTDAFSGCAGLSKVTLPKAPEQTHTFTIGQGAFTYTALTSVDLSSATSIGTAAFTGCTALTAVDLSNVTSIKGGFNGCVNLASVTMPSKEFTFPGGAGFLFKDTKIKEIDLSNLTSGAIGNNMFSGCKDLVSVKMPSGNYTLGNTVFKDCVSLRSLDLSGATILGQNLFQPTQPEDGTGAVYNTYLTELDLSSATRLDPGALRDLPALTSVTLPKAGGYRVRQNVFTGDTALRGVDLSRATVVGDGALAGSGVKAVVLPDDPSVPVFGFSDWDDDGSFAGLFDEGDDTIFLVSGQEALEAYKALGSDSKINKMITPVLATVKAKGDAGEVAAGQELSLLAVPGNAGDGSYQWYRQGDNDKAPVAIGGSTSAAHTKTAALGDAGAYTFSLFGLSLPTARAEVKIGEAPVVAEPSDAKVESFKVRRDHYAIPETGYDGQDHNGQREDYQYIEFDVTFDKPIHLTKEEFAAADGTSTALFDEFWAAMGTYERMKPDGASAYVPPNTAIVLEDGRTLRFQLWCFMNESGQFRFRSVHEDKLLPSVLDSEDRPVKIPDIETWVSVNIYTKIISQKAGTATTPAETTIQIVYPQNTVRGMVHFALLDNGKLAQGKSASPSTECPYANFPARHNYGYLLLDRYNSQLYVADMMEAIPRGFGDPDTSFYTHSGFMTSAAADDTMLTITSKRNRVGEVIDLFVIGYPRVPGMVAIDRAGLKDAVAAAATAARANYADDAWATLQNELAIAKVRAADDTLYYTQANLDETKATLLAAIDNKKDEGGEPSASVTATPVAFSAVTDHGPVTPGKTTDQWLRLDIEFDKAITLSSAAAFFGDTAISLGGQPVGTDSRNRAEVLKDGKTLRLHIYHAATYTGRLLINAKGVGKEVPSITSAGVPAVLPDVSMIVSGIIKDGTEFVTTAQTVGTDSMPASVTKKFTYPASATKGQVHFVVLKNGQPLTGSGGIGSGGFTPTTTGHSSQPFSEYPLDVINSSLSWTGFGSDITVTKPDSVTGSEMELTLTAKTAVAGDVLDVVIVGYPREPGYLGKNPADKTTLKAAIAQADAADAIEYSEANYASLAKELAIARAMDASIWYLQGEIDAQTAKLEAAVADIEGPDTFRTRLSDALFQAEEARSGVASSADGLDVAAPLKWTKPAAHSALSTAIDAARATSLLVDADAQTLLSAIRDLTGATSLFAASLQDGLKAGGGATDPDDPYGKNTARVVSHKAQTGHQAIAGGGAARLPGESGQPNDDDQYMILQISYDRPIHIMGGDPMAEFDAHYGPTWINVGKDGTGIAELKQAGKNPTAGFAEEFSAPADKNTARVLSDGKTLELLLHIPARATDNRLILCAVNEGKTLPAVMDNATMSPVAFPDMNMIVSVLYKDGTEFVRDTQTVGTASTPASSTFTLTNPEQSTRGMIHFLVLKNGVPVKNPDANGANVTIHNHAYLILTSDDLASLAAGVANGLSGITATSDGNKITLVSDTAAVGDVLDMMVVHYPKDRDTGTTKSDLTYQIKSAELADESAFASDKWKALKDEVARAKAIAGSVYYLQAEVDAETALLVSLLDGRGGEVPVNTDTPEFVDLPSHLMFDKNQDGSMYRDISARVKVNGHTIKTIKLGEGLIDDMGGTIYPLTLSAGADYSFEGTTDAGVFALTVKKEVMRSLPAPPDAGYEAKVEITFEDNSTLGFEVHVVDSGGEYDGSHIRIDNEKKKVYMGGAFLAVLAGEDGKLPAVTVAAGDKLRIPVATQGMLGKVVTTIEIGQECDLCAGYIVNNGIGACSTDGSCPDPYGFCTCEGYPGTSRGTSAVPVVRFVTEDGIEVGAPAASTATARFVSEDGVVYLEVEGVSAGQTTVNLESFFAHPNPKKRDGETPIPDGAGVEICKWESWMAERVSNPYEIAITVTGSGTDPGTGPGTNPGTGVGPDPGGNPGTAPGGNASVTATTNNTTNNSTTNNPPATYYYPYGTTTTPAPTVTNAPAPSASGASGTTSTQTPPASTRDVPSTVNTPQVADTIEAPETPQFAPAEQGAGAMQIMIYVLLGLLALALFGFGFVLGNNRSLREQLNRK